MTATQLFTVSDGLINIPDEYPANEVRSNEVIRKLIEVATMCNNASVSGEQSFGQSTETALLRLAIKMKCNDDRKVWNVSLVSILMIFFSGF